MAPPRARILLLLFVATLTPSAALLPHDLSNFQGKWQCDNSVLMGKPKARRGGGRCAQQRRAASCADVTPDLMPSDAS